MGQNQVSFIERCPLFRVSFFRYFDEPLQNPVNKSSSSPAGSDSDEARFRRRKSRSMKKARLQCLPMNFDPSELSQPVIRDRQRIGASLADVDPMNINREVLYVHGF